MTQLRHILLPPITSPHMKYMQCNTHTESQWSLNASAANTDSQMLICTQIQPASLVYRNSVRFWSSLGSQLHPSHTENMCLWMADDLMQVMSRYK